MNPSSHKVDIHEDSQDTIQKNNSLEIVSTCFYQLLQFEYWESLTQRDRDLHTFQSLFSNLPASNKPHVLVLLYAVQNNLDFCKITNCNIYCNHK